MDMTELKIKLPLEQLAEQLGIKFAKVTSRYNWAVCPFHSDTDPSFVVDKHNHLAKCWSPTCIAAKPMDHVRLVQLYEHLPKELAIDRLYQLAGEDRPINSLHDILQRVLERLTVNVHEPIPQEFFMGRGISADALKEFRVGYSPSFEWFRQQIQDIPADEAAKLELFRTTMFDNAIIYPAFDALGRMAGFRSRPLGSSFAKYIANMPEFPLRPTRIYGQHLVRGRQIVLLEGPNDVLSWWSLGVRNVAGMMGTNLHEVDTHLTNHGFSDIVFIADGDEAGKMAMFKAPDLVRVNIIPFDPGKRVDPDEYAKSKGIVAVAKLIEEAKFPFDIRLEARLAKIPSTLTGKIMMIKSLALDMAEGLHSIVVRKLQDKIASALEIPVVDVESIFDLAEFDTSTLENKIVWHVYSKGELTEDVKAKVAATMLADPRLQRQYRELLSGLSPAETVNKIEGLTSGDIDLFLDFVKRRELKKILRQSSSAVANPNQSLDDTLNKIITKISSTSSGDIQVIDFGKQLSIGVSNAIERSKTPGQLLGVSFGQGFEQADMILDGLRPNSMYILAATQGTGKSALALQWAMAMAIDQQVPILWLSLEMSEMDMSIRIMSKLTRIPATAIMRGLTTNEQNTILANQVVKYGMAPFHTVVASGMHITQIVSLVRKYKALHNVRAVFIDYIQLIQGGGKEQSMYERMGHISGMIKSGITMDPTIGIPVVAIAQLSKVAARFDIPISEHIAESYKIAQDADAVLLLHRLSKEDIAANSMEGNVFAGCNMILNIDKNRMGLDKEVLGIIFDRDNLTMREMRKPKKDNVV